MLCSVKRTSDQEQTFWRFQDMWIKVRKSSVAAWVSPTVLAVQLGVEGSTVPRCAARLLHYSVCRLGSESWSSPAAGQPPDLVCVHSRVDQGGRQHCLRSAAHVIRDPDLATTRGPVNCSVTFVKCVIFQNAIKLCESASASKWRKYWTKSRRFIKQSRRIFSGNCGSFTTPRGEWSVT